MEPLIVLPLGIVWFAAVGLTLLDGTRPAIGWLAIIALAASLGATVWLGVDVLQNGTRQFVAGDWPVGVGITFRADELGIVFAVLSLGVLLLALVYEVLGGVGARTFPALVLFLATGLTGLFLTGDIFNFYVFFEISMISAYVLSSYGEQTRQIRAAFIFAVVNVVGSVLFLIAIGAIYHVTGRLDMFGVGSRMPLVIENPAILSAAIIFVALSVKLGLFPFHFWLPAVYTGTRPAVAAILSGALANIGSYGLLRFGAELLPRELELGSDVLLILGLISIIYGAVQAISRHSAVEVLAYSSIGQVGYILIALAVGGQAGYAAAVLYAVINGINKTLLFLSAGLRGWLVGTAFVIGAFSVAGLPPAAGYLGKVALFRTGIEADSWGIVLLVFVGSALSVVYMFQCYAQRFWVSERDSEPSPVAVRAVVVLLALVVVGLGVWPEPLLALSERAATLLPGRTP